MPCSPDSRGRRVADDGMGHDRQVLTGVEDHSARDSDGAVSRSGWADQSVRQQVEQGLIHRLGLRPVQAVRPILDRDQAASLNDPMRPVCRGFDRQHPVSIVVQDQRRHADPSQIISEIGQPGRGACQDVIGEAPSAMLQLCRTSSPLVRSPPRMSPLNKLVRNANGKAGLSLPMPALTPSNTLLSTLVGLSDVLGRNGGIAARNTLSLTRSDRRGLRVSAAFRETPRDRRDLAP